VSVTGVISSGPLLLAMPVAAAAGAVTFLSPCCLPLVPGYLACITGMSGADCGGRHAAAPADAASGRTVAGAALFVLGFSAVFSLMGFTAGGIGELLKSHSAGIIQGLGGVTVLLGLLFFGAFDRFMFAGRVIRPSFMPRAGLAGAPLLGVLFGIGWTPCAGPALGAVQALSLSTGTASRGAFLALIYGLGLGIPFLIVAALFERTTDVLTFFRRNGRLVTRIGGLMLVALGLVEVTGAWTAVIAWMHTHWFQTYAPQL
jgi:cytochrome c-type biogenesis protein